ncbi:MAG TPA: hypothetical protein VFT90_09975 [Chryseosolibacter sp.]|nr:hypothetical protein [Chryseosolibacter sp.]
MKRILFISLLCCLSGAALSQGMETWNIFAKTKFEPKFDEKLGEYLFYPTFTEDVKKLEGKEITLEGFFVPFAPEGDDYIILSKFPMSQCFFCGGGGPESVAEVNFAKDPGRFQVDDLITVKGKLKLNADDLDHINFILVDAVLVND